VLDAGPFGESTDRRVITKTASSALECTRLEHEAEVLVSARHPGVVELLHVDDDEHSLTTAWVGDRSLEVVRTLAPEEAAGVVAALADTLADLHDIGLVHGRVEPSHVILTATGRPVLCGFAGGGYAGTLPPPSPPPPPDFCDPAAPDGVALASSVDVFGVGALLRTLVADGAEDAEPIPERRWWPERLRPWHGYGRRTLLTLADHATADETDRRPTARHLADAIRQAVPGARLPVALGTDDGYEHLRTDETPSGADRGRPAVLLAAGVGLVLLVIGASSLRDGGGAATTAARATSLPPTSNVAPPVQPRGPMPVLDRDGTVHVGEARYAVGAPGDVIALGDWDCDGSVTPALLRTSSGSVFRFDRWATPTVEVEVHAVATVVGAVDLDEAVGPDGCSRLVATLADGSTMEVTP
jgi:hypothetical protein